MSDTEVAITEQLNPKELARRDRLEAVIAAGQKSFREVGQALQAIRQDRLYRATHDTFEAYCKERWGMVHRHADRLIASADAVGVLGPNGPKPANEAQARPLTKLRDEDGELDADAIRETWQEAVEAAGDKPVAAKHVQAAVRRRVQAPGDSTEPTPAEGEASKPRGKGLRYAAEAVNILRKIPTSDALRQEAMDYVIRWIKQNR